MTHPIGDDYIQQWATMIISQTHTMEGGVMETTEKRGYTMVEACGYLGGISRATMYRLLGAGQISSYHIGGRRYFTKESLDLFIDTQIEMEGGNYGKHITEATQG